MKLYWIKDANTIIVLHKYPHGFQRDPVRYKYNLHT